MKTGYEQMLIIVLKSSSLIHKYVDKGVKNINK